MTNAVNLASAAGTGFAFRNRIINGDMRIDQRGNAVATTGFPVDRWQTYAFNTGSITRQISTVAPANFTSSLSWVVGTAGTRNSGDAYIIQQAVEAYNIADTNQGTANALPLTLSFWTRSSVTGLYSGALSNSTNDRCCAFTYTINAANTWEYKTIIIPGDTTGTWYTDNRIGTLVRFDLGSGSTFQAPSAGSWLASANRSGIAGTVSLAQTTGASFYLTGVQLEVGSVATPFERRLIGIEELFCQRYFIRNSRISGIWINAQMFRCTYPFPTAMRAAPSISIWDSNGYHEWWNQTGYFGISGLAGSASVLSADLIMTSSVNRGRTFNDPALLETGVIAMNAEL